MFLTQSYDFRRIKHTNRGLLLWWFLIFFWSFKAPVLNCNCMKKSDQHIWQNVSFYFMEDKSMQA